MSNESSSTGPFGAVTAFDTAGHDVLFSSLEELFVLPVCLTSTSCTYYTGPYLCYISYNRKIIESGHVKQILSKLHWLPVKQFVDFKILKAFR